uniref:Uncharacterized protein n=1 Tax=Cacopsylla melanoneura TaxID=428564 RepID=A0A8D9B4B8_9HEMI
MKSSKRSAPLPPSLALNLPPISCPDMSLSQCSLSLSLGPHCLPTQGQCYCKKTDVTTLLTELSNPNDELWTLMDQSYESEINSIRAMKSATNKEIIRDEEITFDQTNEKLELDRDEKLACELADSVTFLTSNDSEKKKSFQDLSEAISPEDVLYKSDTLPSIVKVKLKDKPELEKEESELNTKPLLRTGNNCTPKYEKKLVVNRPEFLSSMEDVIHKVNENYSKNIFLNLNYTPVFTGYYQLPARARNTKVSSENINTKIVSDNSFNSDNDIGDKGVTEDSSCKKMLDYPNDDDGKNTQTEKEEKICTDEIQRKYDVRVVNEDFNSNEPRDDSPDVKTAGEEDSTQADIIREEITSVDIQTGIIPPPNAFANNNNVVDVKSDENQSYSFGDKTMDIILDDLEAQTVNDLHENVNKMNTFTNPLTQVTYYSYAQEFNQYLSTMLSDKSGNETNDEIAPIVETYGNLYSKRNELIKRSFTSSFSNQDEDSCNIKDKAFISQEELDSIVDSPEVSSLTDFTINDLDLNAMSETCWKFVKPIHSDSVEVNLSDDDERNSGYDSSSEDSGGKPDPNESSVSPPLKPDDLSNDEEVSNFLFRLNSDVEKFLNGDRKIENCDLNPGITSPLVDDSGHSQEVKKFEFKKQKKILPLVLQNSLTGSSYPANHPEFIDELKDNACYLV